MGGLLDGKEVEGKIGEVGSYSLDATKEGKVIAELTVEVTYLDGAGKAAVSAKNETDLFKILENVATKNGKPWIASSVETIKNILGIVG